MGDYEIRVEAESGAKKNSKQKKIWKKTINNRIIKMNNKLLCAQQCGKHLLGALATAE